MDRLLVVPAGVRDAVRQALGSHPADAPEVAYRLASGFCTNADRNLVGLWVLDNPAQFRARQCTVAAALRGGNPGKRWALASALTDELDTEQLLNDAVRSDYLLVPQLAAAIHVAWERMLDHATRKARQRMQRSSEGRASDFTKFPNAAVAHYAGLDDLLDRTWDAFVLTVAAILADYARTQGTLVAVLDGPTAASVEHTIERRSEQAVAALVAFLDQRARDFMVGDTEFAPQDFAVARAIAAWVSGALPAPEGFTFVDLQALGKLSVTAMSTAQDALATLAATRLERSLTWHHSFYGTPAQPYLPHIEADGLVVTDDAARDLSIHPGDHVGCRCALVPEWSLA